MVFNHQFIGVFSINYLHSTIHLFYLFLQYISYSAFSKWSTWCAINYYPGWNKSEKSFDANLFCRNCWWIKWRVKRLWRLWWWIFYRLEKWLIFFYFDLNLNNAKRNNIRVKFWSAIRFVFGITDKSNYLTFGWYYFDSPFE